MQIFVTDKSPYFSAINLDDLRLNKMILESSQLLSAALYIHGVDETILPSKPGWYKHPLAKWTAEYLEHYKWVFAHFAHLLEEFFYRKGKHHKYYPFTKFYYNKICYLTNKPEIDRYTGYKLPPQYVDTLTSCGSIFVPKFYNATTMKNVDKPIYGIYKDYLNWKWQNDISIPTWTKREPPSWSKINV